MNMEPASNHVIRVFRAPVGEEISTKTKSCKQACHDPVNVPISEVPAFAVLVNGASVNGASVKAAKARRRKLEAYEEAKAGAFAYEGVLLVVYDSAINKDCKTDI
jgi:hypothetical protein